MSERNEHQPLALTLEELHLDRVVAVFSVTYGILGYYEIKSAPYYNDFDFHCIDIARIGSDFVESRSLASLGVIPHPNNEWNRINCMIDPVHHRVLPDPTGERMILDNIDAIDVDTYVE